MQVQLCAYCSAHDTIACFIYVPRDSDAFHEFLSPTFNELVAGDKHPETVALKFVDNLGGPEGATYTPFEHVALRHGTAYANALSEALSRNVIANHDELELYYKRAIASVSVNTSLARCREVAKDMDPRVLKDTCAHYGVLHTDFSSFLGSVYTLRDDAPEPTSPMYDAPCTLPNMAIVPSDKNSADEPLDLADPEDWEAQCSLEALDRALERMPSEEFCSSIEPIFEDPEFDRWIDAEVSEHPKDNNRMSRARRKQVVDLGLVATLRSGTEREATPTPSHSRACLNDTCSAGGAPGAAGQAAVHAPSALDAAGTQRALETSRREPTPTRDCSGYQQAPACLASPYVVPGHTSSAPGSAPDYVPMVNVSMRAESEVPVGIERELARIVPEPHARVKVEEPHHLSANIHTPSREAYSPYQGGASNASSHPMGPSVTFVPTSVCVDPVGTYNSSGLNPIANAPRAAEEGSDNGTLVSADQLDKVKSECLTSRPYTEITSDIPSEAAATVDDYLALPSSMQRAQDAPLHTGRRDDWGRRWEEWELAHSARPVPRDHELTLAPPSHTPSHEVAPRPHEGKPAEDRQAGRHESLQFEFSHDMLFEPEHHGVEVMSQEDVNNVERVERIRSQLFVCS